MFDLMCLIPLSLRKSTNADDVNCGPLLVAMTRVSSKDGSQECYGSGGICGESKGYFWPLTEVITK